MSPLPEKIVLGTRGSALALAQADLAAAALRRAHPELAVEIKVIVTKGDQRHDIDLIKQSPAGAKGLFTREIEEALLRREIDLAVHSCKDLPGDMPEGLILAAVLERAATADVLLTSSAPGFLSLSSGATVGTSSVRRARQLLWKRPDLKIESIRGNVPTRIRKLRESSTMEGTVLALAGLQRLGFRIESGMLEDGEGSPLHAEILEMLPAIGQGAIALQCRVDTAPIIAVVNHEATWLAIRAERELMRLLNGDCNLPVGVLTERQGSNLRMRVVLFDATDAPPKVAEAVAPLVQPEQLALAAFTALS